jgi:hypothetical protein
LVVNLRLDPESTTRRGREGTEADATPVARQPSPWSSAITSTALIDLGFGRVRDTLPFDLIASAVIPTAKRRPRMASAPNSFILSLELDYQPL